MALIKCSECGNMVSSMAPACTRCGCPTNKMELKSKFYFDIDKDIDYGYAMTTHKTQGSTFDNVAIDLTNIVFLQTRFGRKEVDIDIRNKLIYVALSRAKNSVILKY